MPRYIGHSIANTAGKVVTNIIDPNISSVELLLDFNDVHGNGNLTDTSPSGKTVSAAGNAAVSTTQNKFGTHSLALDGTGDYVSAPYSTDWDFGTGDFTIELWYRPDSTVGQQQGLIQCMGTTSGTGWALTYFQSSNTFYLQFLDQASSTLTQVPTTSFRNYISDNTWAHIALSRQGTAFRTFVDGALVSTTTSSYSPKPSVNGLLKIGVGSGNDWLSNHYAKGYIDGVRVTKGVARYTSAFTTPTRFTVNNTWNSGVWTISGSGNNTVNTRRKTGKWTDAPWVAGGRHGPQLSTLVDYLVIAGGAGGGGGNGGGGGGAGGYRSSWAGVPGSELTGGGAAIETEFTAPVGTPYTITVGAGGAAGPAPSSSGSQGVSSSIAGTGLTTISTVGGGFGERGDVHTGSGGVGGSGGGGGSGPGPAFNPGGAGTSGQGSTGGAGKHGPGVHQSGGGGGGGTAIGVDAGNNYGGAGGAGTPSTISGSSVQRAGGGGGGNHSVGTTAGAGGAGGGGDGWLHSNNNGSAGTANKGGGGGGMGNAVPTHSGAGGSGVVILRMLTTAYPGTQSGGTVTTSGSHTIITYNSSGTFTS